MELYFAIGYARLNDFEQADRHFDQAADRAMGPNAAFLARVAYERARRYLMERRIEEAWTAYGETLKDRSLRGRVHSEQLKSFIFCREERFDKQAAAMLKAARLMDSRRSDFLEYWYLSVQTLAMIAREMILPQARQYAEKALDDGDPWPPDVAINHFQALKAIGWCKALAGDQLSCFRYLRHAQEVAPDAAWRAMVHLDRGYFARTIGETQWSLNELAQAEEIAEPVEWANCQSEERIALLLFAELFAAVDKEKAAFYIARYNALGKLASPLLHFAHDNRLAALAAYATGVVREANGALDHAHVSYKASWDTFDRIGYEWRAGRAATRLFSLTGSRRWKLSAQHALETYPRAWLWDELKKANPRRSRVRKNDLTPAQATVLGMIRKGMSTHEIAHTLGRSQSTVRNHLKVIFKVYGVRSRVALVAEAARKERVSS
ncbi:MAG: helix-turn-helix transcriptional regulator [Candidatus Eremiobacteraeota bacterium]|nr:helix-turn-helix transcriptional regulator [Candidatus Eremiobacteraeota bacterium]MBV9972263.1 helix-turn-helix transcriptional regulator [Candidatus Eremiobacteraeota bacterium]